MVLLLAQCRFYGYFSMKGRTKQGIPHPYLPFSPLFWYTQSMHKQTIIDFKELGLRHIFTKPIKKLKNQRPRPSRRLFWERSKPIRSKVLCLGYVSCEAALLLRKNLAVHPSTTYGRVSPLFYHPREGRNPSFPRGLWGQWIFQPIGKEEVEAPAYQEAIETIHHHIRQGDTYQVNYTVQLSQELKLTLWPSTIAWWWRQRPITMPSSSTMMWPSSPLVLSSFWARRQATDHAPYEGYDRAVVLPTRGLQGGC